MNRRAITFSLVMLFFSVLTFSPLQAQEPDHQPRIQIIPDQVEVMVGDSVQLQAVYIDSSGTETDTAANWSVTPDSLGVFASMGLFTATHSGDGLIIAGFGQLTDTVAVTVEPGESEGEEPFLRISPESVHLMVGDSIQMTARLIDSTGTALDTMVSWSLEPDSLGNITSDGLFTAEAAGHGSIQASLGLLTASAEVEVEAESEGDDHGEHDNPLVIMPQDTVVAVGSDIQFQAYFQDSSGVLNDTTAEWSLDGMAIGSISESGLLEANAVGFGVVRAQLDNWTTSATVIVQDTVYDSTGVNSVTITRSHNGHMTAMHSVTEGEIWVVGGLPYPMNILNGTRVYFPNGSLTEDINIQMSLPSFADTAGDSVEFGHHIAAGVDFQVFVNDTLAEPYYFETPIYVAIPFKRGLLRHLNIAPSSLGLYFAMTHTDSIAFDSTGITQTSVDTASNRIYASVAHFSTLVVKPKSSSPTGINSEPVEVPKGFALEQNYPNPFNPETSIHYRIPNASHVKLTVYNSLGQVVQTLINKSLPAGEYSVRWNGRDQLGNKASSGMYFYRIQAGDYTKTRKMILMK